MLGAQYYDDEYITKKLLTLNGDIDQYEAMMERRVAEDLDRSFDEPQEPTGPVSDDGNA